MASNGSVTGFDQWRRNLHRIERQVQDRARDSVAAAIGMNLTTSNQLTPIGTRRYTRHGESHPGYLKTRNQTRIIENGPYRYVGEYFNDAPYAAAVALGSVHVSSLGTIYSIAAQDFVTPGFYAGRKKLLEGGGRVI